VSIKDWFFALAIAQIITALFGILFRDMRFRSGLWIFFLIFIPASWAGGIWITPYGSIFYGVSWLSFFLIGLFTALILATLISPARRTRSVDPVKATSSESPVVFVITILFWVLLLGFLAVIFLAYL
jgi:hypothetical protein